MPNSMKRCSHLPSFQIFIRLLPLLIILFLNHCSSQRKFQDGSELLLAQAPAVLSDDLGMESLLQSLETQIAFLDSPQSARFPNFRFGKLNISRESYRESLKNIFSKRASREPAGTKL